ncbi:MAG: PqiC family protein [Desulfobacterales bacterium]
MLQRSILKTILSTGLLLTFVAGCAGPSPRSNYYLLNALPDQETGQTTTAASDGLSIGIGPVSWPDYLDRQQIVIRTGPNEITFSEFDRWAEPLKNNFMRVFKEDLVERLRTDNIFIYPWLPDVVFEFQVSVEVTRFEARQGDSTSLDVQWMILRAHDREVVVSRKSSYTIDLVGSDYKTIVAAQSRTVADFSREVAAAVTEVYRREHGY